MARGSDGVGTEVVPPPGSASKPRRLLLVSPFLYS